ncbi:MAG: transcription antitermination factor NusB [Cytophagales bacterium]|nr:MAG: transcription antitermination factor NusB [Cytophagales bacterium]
MLNRRILRAKAMQALFALNQAKISNYHHAHEYFKEVFAPDLNSMEVQDHAKLQSQIEESSKLFDNAYLKEKAVLPETENNVRNTVLNALAQYHNQNNKDLKHFGRQMVELAEMLAQNYILLLSFPLEICNYLEERNDNKKVRYTKQNELTFESKIANNALVILLQNDQSLSKLRARYSSAWDRDIIKKVWTEFSEKDEAYASYLKIEHPSFEEDKSILLHLFKQGIFKNEIAQSYLEEYNILWEEDKSIIKSLVTRTIKSIEPESTSIQLLDISSNWEEDKDFFLTLYELTVENDKYLQELIEQKLKNWDMDRIATTDKIILHMALCEMLYFPSIPTKVTINEYIEICKEYSTPKSKQFVNGILDKISVELIANGKIKKSGRGLLDNKS